MAHFYSLYQKCTYLKVIDILSCHGLISHWYVWWSGLNCPISYTLKAKASQEGRKGSFLIKGLLRKIIVVKQWYMPNKTFGFWNLIKYFGTIIIILRHVLVLVLICRKYFSRLNSTQYNYVYSVFKISNFI